MPCLDSGADFPLLCLNGNFSFVLRNPYQQHWNAMKYPLISFVTKRWLCNNMKAIFRIFKNCIKCRDHVFYSIYEYLTGSANPPAWSQTNSLIPVHLRRNRVNISRTGTSKVSLNSSLPHLHHSDESNNRTVRHGPSSRIKMLFRKTLPAGDKPIYSVTNSHLLGEWGKWRGRVWGGGYKYTCVEEGC